MSRTGRRCVGGAVAFALAAVWTTAGPWSALGCLLAAGIGVALVAGLDRFDSARTRVPAGKTSAHRRTADAGRERSHPRQRRAVQQDAEPVAATLVDAGSYGW